MNNVVLLSFNTYPGMIIGCLTIIDMYAHNLYGDIYVNVSFDNWWCYVRFYFLLVSLCSIYQSYLLQSVFSFASCCFFQIKTTSKCCFHLSFDRFSMVNEFSCCFTVVHFQSFRIFTSLLSLSNCLSKSSSFNSRCFSDLLFSNGRDRFDLRLYYLLHSSKNSFNDSTKSTTIKSTRSYRFTSNNKSRQFTLGAQFSQYNSLVTLFHNGLFIFVELSFTMVKFFDFSYYFTFY